jgi:hypothetical protein
MYGTQSSTSLYSSFVDKGIICKHDHLFLGSSLKGLEI